MFYRSPLKEIARRTKDYVLEALGMGLADADDDTLEAGVEAQVVRALEDSADYWNPAWNL